MSDDRERQKAMNRLMAHFVYRDEFDRAQVHELALEYAAACGWTEPKPIPDRRRRVSRSPGAPTRRSTTVPTTPERVRCGMPDCPSYNCGCK